MGSFKGGTNVRTVRSFSDGANMQTVGSFDGDTNMRIVSEHPNSGIIHNSEIIHADMRTAGSVMQTVNRGII